MQKTFEVRPRDAEWRDLRSKLNTIPIGIFMAGTEFPTVLEILRNVAPIPDYDFLAVERRIAEYEALLEQALKNVDKANDGIDRFIELSGKVARDYTPSAYLKSHRDQKKS